MIWKGFGKKIVLHHLDISKEHFLCLLVKLTSTHLHYLYNIDSYKCCYDFVKDASNIKRALKPFEAVFLNLCEKESS